MATGDIVFKSDEDLNVLIQWLITEHLNLLSSYHALKSTVAVQQCLILGLDTSNVKHYESLLEEAAAVMKPRYIEAFKDRFAGYDGELDNLLRLQLDDSEGT